MSDTEESQLSRRRKRKSSKKKKKKKKKKPEETIGEQPNEGQEKKKPKKAAVALPPSGIDVHVARFQGKRLEKVAAENQSLSQSTRVFRLRKARLDFVKTPAQRREEAKQQAKKAKQAKLAKEQRGDEVRASASSSDLVSTSNLHLAPSMVALDLLGEPEEEEQQQPGTAMDLVDVVSGPGSLRYAAYAAAATVASIVAWLAWNFHIATTSGNQQQ